MSYSFSMKTLAVPVAKVQRKCYLERVSSNIRRSTPELKQCTGPELTRCSIKEPEHEPPGGLEPPALGLARHAYAAELIQATIRAQ